jgi:hypothetical protein
VHCTKPARFGHFFVRNKEFTMSENNIIAPVLNAEQALKKAEFTDFQAASQAKTSAQAMDVFKSLPNFHTLKPSPIPLNSGYLTPELVGEKWLIVVLGIERLIYIDQKTGEPIPLDCVVFIQQKEDLSLVKWRNGACKFVAVIQSALSTGTIQAGETPLQLEYTGKTRTKSGNFVDEFNVNLLR